MQNVSLQDILEYSKKSSCEVSRLLFLKRKEFADLNRLYEKENCKLSFFTLLLFVSFDG